MVAHARRHSGVMVYVPTAILVYISYFVLGFSLFAQAQYKEALGAQWGTTTAGVASAIAWMMVGRLIGTPFGGIVADRVSRRIGAIIGGIILGLSFIMLIGVYGALLGTLACVVAGIGNGFLDPAAYPVLSEIFKEKGHIANLFLKMAILIAQFILPFIIKWTGGAGAHGGYRGVYWGFVIVIAICVVLLFFTPFPRNESKKQATREGERAEKKKLSLGRDGILIVLLGATTLTTFTLWGNTNQELGKAYGLADPSITQSWYAIGAVLAVLLSAAVLTKVRVTFIIVIYPLISAITLLATIFIHTPWIVPIAGFIIGWTGAGGVLQLVTSTATTMFPQARGVMTSAVMISSAVGCFIIQQIAAPWVSTQPRIVLAINVVVTLIGVVMAVIVDRDSARSHTQHD